MVSNSWYNKNVVAELFPHFVDDVGVDFVDHFVSRLPHVVVDAVSHVVNQIYVLKIFRQISKLIKFIKLFELFKCQIL